MDEIRVDDKTILSLSRHVREKIVGSTETHGWTLKPEFHQAYMEALGECFGVNKVVYDAEQHTFVCDGTMFIHLVLSNPQKQHIVMFNNTGDDMSDDENYAVLGFYGAVGETYDIDYETLE